MTSGVVPSATMRTKDGKFIIIGGNGDSVYTRLMAAVGRPDMGADNPKFASNSKRCEHEGEIYGVSPPPYPPWGSVSHLWVSISSSTQL